MNAAGPSAPTGALAGVRVLDLTTLYPGPLATMLLADLGADVIRIDAPERDDLLRWMPPHGPDGQGAMWRTVGRNKRSIAIDLKAEAGIAVFLRLCATADVVVEQFRPGVLARLGLGWATLHAQFPKLVLCSISAFGQTGPEAQRAGHDIGFLARSGTSWHLGRSGEGPVPLGVLVGDVGGGTWPAVAGVLAALLHRGRTGEGQHVDIAMADGALLMNAMAATEALAVDTDHAAEGGWLNGGSFYDYYRTADGRHLAIGALEPKFWSQMLAVLGLSAREADYLADGEAGVAVKTAIAAAVVAETLDHWRGRFAAVDCCVEPVSTPREAVADPLFVDRSMVVAVPDFDGGVSQQVGCPIRLSAAPARYDHVGPEPGQHSDLVLREVGYDDAAIAALRASHVVIGRAG
jgi:alpha-methylacyl-CoA racemase